MYTCPVCDAKSDTLVCPSCGFDSSCDYERWPTIARLKKPVDSVKKRRSAHLSIDPSPDPIPKPRKYTFGKWAKGLCCAFLLIILLSCLGATLAHPRDGWCVKGENTFYYQDGKKVTGFRTIDGDTYYFNANGVMQTGSLTLSGKTFYFGLDGKYLPQMNVEIELNEQATAGNSSGQNSGSNNSSGSSGQDGWYTADGNTYYFQNGKKVTDWAEIDGKTYHFDSNGVMTTGWLTVNTLINLNGFVERVKLKYYFDSNGIMQTGHVTIDGTEYYFNESGVLQSD